MRGQPTNNNKLVLLHWICSGKHNNLLSFYIISKNWEGTDSGFFTKSPCYNAFIFGKSLKNILCALIAINILWQAWRWSHFHDFILKHYSDVITGAMPSQITSFTIVYPSVCSGAYPRKHQSSASLAYVWGINRSPVNSPYNGPVTRKMFPLMTSSWIIVGWYWFTSINSKHLAASSPIISKHMKYPTI